MSNLENFLESYVNGTEPGIVYGRKPSGYWDNWDNVERELTDIIKEIGHFPSQKELVSRGYGSLANAILDHGGFSNVRQKMGFELVRKPNGYYRVFENVRRKLEDIISKLGHFPSLEELCNLKESSLAAAFNQFHGGVNNVRVKMGYETLEYKVERFRKFPNVKKVLNGLIQEIGHFPSAEELRKL